MVAPKLLTIDAEEIRKIVHDLAQGAAVADSAISMVEEDRLLPERFREDVQDCATGCRTVCAQVRLLQKLVG